jgi:phosphate transport system permease protein
MSETVVTETVDLPNHSKDIATRKKNSADAVRQSLKKRYAAERRFRTYGVMALVFAFLMLVTLFTTIIGNGYTAFVQTMVRLDVHLDAQVIDPKGTRRPEVLGNAGYGLLVKKSLRKMFPEVRARRDKKKVYGIISLLGANDTLRAAVLENPSIVGTTISIWVPSSDDADMLMKGHISRDVVEKERRVTNKEIAWLDKLIIDKRLETQFNTRFFTSGDSREPELAGVWGAAVGSLLTLVITLLLSFPLGVAAAVYLEEFAPKNRWTQLIEVNINNLAAVPSIVFGLLGLAVLLNFVGMPRSAPVVGGIVLALMTLPTVIITGRAALTSVPPSIREAALGVGASRVQTIFHHVLPLAMPGILTGSIIGMARALGETAPLLMIGMVAFIVDVPQGFTDPSTVLPVQIYLWADSPERAFVEKTSAAIIVLLAFLVTMNALAVWLRQKFETRW